MAPDNTPRILSFGRPSAFSLALATAVAGLTIGACRLITHVASFDRAELDGIAFLAAIYWVISAVGYFAPRSSRLWRKEGGVMQPAKRGGEGGHGMRDYETPRRRSERTQGVEMGGERRAPALADHCV
jgi:hypothetical protein